MHITDEAIDALFSHPIRIGPDCPLIYRKEDRKQAQRKMPRRCRIGKSLRFLILQRDGYRCQICGATAQSGAILEVDHKRPVAQGGTSDEANLWTLCRDCNRGKGARQA